LKPILKWQYTQLIKELLLLQGHAADQTCPCKTDGENCVRKHLLSIQALAEETQPIESDSGRNDELYTLAGQARQMVELEEQSLCGQSPEMPESLEDFARRWRKQFESYALACEVVTKPAGPPHDDGEPDSCVADIKARLPAWCLNEHAWGETRRGVTCYNPWAVCQSKNT